MPYWAAHQALCARTALGGTAQPVEERRNGGPRCGPPLTIVRDVECPRWLAGRWLGGRDLGTAPLRDDERATEDQQRKGKPA